MSRAPHECRGCGEGFSCLSAFDRHQTMEDGRVVCHRPDVRGLTWQAERRGAAAWGWPPPETPERDSIWGDAA